MHVAIDSAGRVVVPKQLRETLGLRAGSLLEISERDGSIVMLPVSEHMRLVRRGGRLVVEPEHPLPTLTADEVRSVLESVRR